MGHKGMFLLTLVGISAWLNSPLVKAKDSQPQALAPEPRCLSGGILEGYRCRDNDMLTNTTRFSIQLLQDSSLGLKVFSIPIYHQTSLDARRSFIYLGEYDSKDQALVEIEGLVDAELLELEQWRPAVVEIDKSEKVPSIRLVQMYRTDSYAYLAPKGEQDDISPELVVSRSTESIISLMQYYTIQLGAFNGPLGAYDFALEHSELNPLCRVKRNGRYAVYSGAYKSEKQARLALKDASDGAYVLRLKNEDMYSCDQSQQVLVRSASIKSDVKHASSVSEEKVNNGSLMGNSTFYTIQLAAFSDSDAASDFVLQHQSLGLLCRTKRNGRYAIYHGAYDAKVLAKKALKEIPVDGYVLRLKNEKMYSCDSSKQLVYGPGMGAKAELNKPIAESEPAGHWTPASDEPFYTIQLAAFDRRLREQSFIRQHPGRALLCRVRRNGKFAVYDGQFKNYVAAKRRLQSLSSKNAYVVRLTGELLPPCQG